MPTAVLKARTVTQLLDHGIAVPTSPSRVAKSPGTSLPPAAADLDSQVLAVAQKIRPVSRNPRLVAVATAVTKVGNPLDLAKKMIAARYEALGGASGFLGAAKTAVTVCPDKTGYFRHFAGGSIYWHPHAGAHEVHGAIRALWASLQWERGFLGYPLTDETAGGDPQRRGRFNHFQGGSIYWHPDSGAHEVHGAIRAKYLALGAETSFLGYPTTDETGTPDKVGRFNHFQGGSIYWTPSTWAHEVHGLIRGYWAAHGWERNGALGYPVSDERVPHRGIGYTLGIVSIPPGMLLSAGVLKIPEATTTPVPAKPTSKSPTLSLKAATANMQVVRPKTATGVAMLSRVSTASTTAVKSKNVAGALRGSVLTKVPIRINPGLVTFRDHTGPSRDRYSDFENGVVFWRSGAAAAEMLAPRAKAPNGAKMAWTAAEITALAGARVRAALGVVPGATVQAISFAGTTGYSWDGAGVHNRAHRLNVVLLGRRRLGPVTVPVPATVQVCVEISFDPVDREIVGYVSSWRLVASQGDSEGGGSLIRVLHARLDPALWRQFHITTVPATKKDPIAVLSVKTLSDGRVAVYFEP